MARTLINGGQVSDGTVTRIDLNATTPGQSVIRKIIPGRGIGMLSSGPDEGTGDVSISAMSWYFLGQGVANGTVRSNVVSWVGTYKQLWIEYYISGYSNISIGRVICGTTAGISETAGTHCSSLIEGVTLNSTSVSVPGWPTGVTLSNVARYGHMYIMNVANQVKRMTGHGQHSGTAPTTVPIQMRMAGMYNNTTSLINSIGFVNYDNITATVVSPRTFNAGTYINVWGRNDD